MTIPQLLIAIAEQWTVTVSCAGAGTIRGIPVSFDRGVFRILCTDGLTYTRLLRV